MICFTEYDSDDDDDCGGRDKLSGARSVGLSRHQWADKIRSPDKHSARHTPQQGTANRAKSSDATGHLPPRSSMLQRATNTDYNTGQELLGFLSFFFNLFFFKPPHPR